MRPFSPGGVAWALPASSANPSSPPATAVFHLGISAPLVGGGAASRAWRAPSSVPARVFAAPDPWLALEGRALRRFGDRRDQAVGVGLVVVVHEAGADGPVRREAEVALELP